MWTPVSRSRLACEHIPGRQSDLPRGTSGDAVGDLARSPETCAACTALVARQPIFDSTLAVVAYELLYRTIGATSACFSNAAAATAEVIVSAAMDIGLDRLIGKAPAYINFPRELLIRPPPLPMQPELVVIEVLEGVQPDSEVMAGLASLRSQGYRIALDDYDIRSANPLLLELADVVKIDVREYSADELQRCVRRIRETRVELVAEKVETRDELALCRELRFDYYQGYFLQRPEIVSTRRVPTNRLVTMKLLLDLHDPNVSVAVIEAAIARDVGISYRILRCINSSYYQLPRPVSSMRQAIMLLGFSELRKLCAAVMLAGLNDQPLYVVTQAMARAKMCEALCVNAGLNGSEIYFMTGLLSVVDVLLGLSLDDALRALPLSAPVKAALLRHEGPLGAALACALRYERGEWDGIVFMSLPTHAISETYRQAASWADGALGALANSA